MIELRLFANKVYVCVSYTFQVKKDLKLPSGQYARLSGEQILKGETNREKIPAPGRDLQFHPGQPLSPSIYIVAMTVWRMRQMRPRLSNVQT